MKRDNYTQKIQECILKYTQLHQRFANAHCAVMADDPFVHSFEYCKVNGFSLIEKEESFESSPRPYRYMEGLFTALHTAKAVFSIIFKGSQSGVEVFIGTDQENFLLLIDLLKANFPNILLEFNRAFDYSNQNVKKYTSHHLLFEAQAYKFGGYLKGNPALQQESDMISGINKVVNGISSKEWSICLFASPISGANTMERYKAWLNEATRFSEFAQAQFSSVDGLESVSSTKKYYECEEYVKRIEYMCENLSCALNEGEWNVTVTYGTESATVAKLLTALYVSAFSDETYPVFEPMHALQNEYGFQPVLIQGLAPENLHYDYIQLGYSAITNNLNGNELSCLCTLPSEDTIGFSVNEYVGFDVSQRKKGDISLGNIIFNGMDTDSEYLVDLNSFNRHCLVIGLTGGGKTNTLKSIFNTILEQRRDFPFLIIEPAKREYWELYKCGFENLQIYSIGSPPSKGYHYCLNPFERIGNVPLQTHIDYVFAAFKASFIMYTPMPYVLESAIYNIYENCGWDIAADSNTYGEIYPTIEDLFLEIPKVVTDMGYDAKMRNDLIGSLQARINSLRLGNKGDTLNVAKSFDIQKILHSQVIIELEDIGDDDVKAFIISNILIQLSEYRKQQSDAQLSVRHLLLIEEAHRLLKNVSAGTGENADPRGAAVEFFCNLLAELRSKGQGFVVADQIPSKLAPDLIKNTNIKILHRTVDEDDRLLMGGAMHMTDEQKEQIAAFEQGTAAIYSEGDYRPKLVHTKYAGVYEKTELASLSREQVLARVQKNCFTAENRCLSGRNPFCLRCNKACVEDFRQKMQYRLTGNEYEALLRDCNPKANSHLTVRMIRNHIENYVENTLGLMPSQPIYREIVNCVLMNVMHSLPISEQNRLKILKLFNTRG